MAVVNVRELARNTSKVLGDVTRRHRPTLITKGGRPLILMLPVDADAMEDWILANAPEFVEGMKQADKEFRRGETISLEDFLARESRRRRTPTARRAAKRKRS